MEGRLSEGGGPGFLVHGDLVWICRDTMEQGHAHLLKIQYNVRIASKID